MIRPLVMDRPMPATKVEARPLCRSGPRSTTTLMRPPTWSRAGPKLRVDLGAPQAGPGCRPSRATGRKPRTPHSCGTAGSGPDRPRRHSFQRERAPRRAGTRGLSQRAGHQAGLVGMSRRTGYWPHPFGSQGVSNPMTPQRPRRPETPAPLTPRCLGRWRPETPASRAATPHAAARGEGPQHGHEGGIKLLPLVAPRGGVGDGSPWGAAQQRRSRGVCRGPHTSPPACSHCRGKHRCSNTG